MIIIILIDATCSGMWTTTNICDKHRSLNSLETYKCPLFPQWSIPCREKPLQTNSLYIFNLGESPAISVSCEGTDTVLWPTSCGKYMVTDVDLLLTVTPSVAANRSYLVWRLLLNSLALSGTVDVVLPNSWPCEGSLRQNVMSTGEIWTVFLFKVYSALRFIITLMSSLIVYDGFCSDFAKAHHGLWLAYGKHYSIMTVWQWVHKRFLL